MNEATFPPGLHDIHDFGLIEALLGRRSRRFFMGAEIPDGVFAFKSKQEVMPLSELGLGIEFGQNPTLGSLTI